MNDTALVHFGQRGDGLILIDRDKRAGPPSPLVSIKKQ